jgi:hypothetical protein
VRGEDARCRRVPEGFIEGQPIFVHSHADDFQRGKRRVAFVHVIHARLNSQRRERPDSANPQDDFLADPDAVVAAVKPGG